MGNLKKVILSVAAIIFCAVSSFGNDDDTQKSNEVYFEGHRGETSVIFKREILQQLQFKPLMIIL